jgi:hypothetical protein
MRRHEDGHEGETKQSASVLMRECMNCGDEAKMLFFDPRTPPLSIGPCLCGYCALGELRDLMTDVSREISHVEDAMRDADEEGD